MTTFSYISLYHYLLFLGLIIRIEKKERKWQKKNEIQEFEDWFSSWKNQVWCTVMFIYFSFFGWKLTFSLLCLYIHRKKTILPIHLVFFCCFTWENKNKKNSIINIENDLCKTIPKKKSQIKIWFLFIHYEHASNEQPKKKSQKKHFNEIIIID